MEMEMETERSFTIPSPREIDQKDRLGPAWSQLRNRERERERRL